MPALIFERAPAHSTNTLLTRRRHVQGQGDDQSDLQTTMLSISFTGSDANLSRQPLLKNRIVSHDPTKFVHISFANLFYVNDYRKEKYLQRIEDILNQGVEIERKNYLFCGHSNSQLQSRSCFLYAANSNYAVVSMINGFGDFDKIRDVGKRAKRIGLLFSSAELVVNLNPNNCQNIIDIVRNGHIFTDGCGLISGKFAEEITTKIKSNSAAISPSTNSNSTMNYCPKVFQIRYKGYKGILMVAKEEEMKIVKKVPDTIPNIFLGFVRSFFATISDSNAETKVMFRESMLKFRNSRSEDLCILGTSKPSSCGKLNAELVSILSTLGIPDEVFLKKQADYFHFIKSASKNPQAAVEFLEYKVRFDLVQKLADAGNFEMAPSWIKAQLSIMQKEELKYSFDKYDFERVHIRIPDSRLLLGVCDTTGHLQEGQCIVIITSNSKTLERLTLTGKIIVGRNPCLHPGDVQVLHAVDTLYFPELDHLVDCIVFSTNGKLPPASCMSGGDLDGDKFWVCWDDELIQIKPTAPLDYSKLAPTPCAVFPTSEITQLDMIRYFARYTTSLGEVTTLYWAWIRANSKERAFSSECVRLNELYSRCVDGEKIAIPLDLRHPPKFIHGGMEKPFILDILIKNVKDLLSHRFQGFLKTNDERDQDQDQDQKQEYAGGVDNVFSDPDPDEHDIDIFRDELNQLSAMGFQDRDTNIQALIVTSGDILLAVEILSELRFHSNMKVEEKQENKIYTTSQTPERIKENDYQNELEKLRGMGFMCDELNLQMLEVTSGNVNSAVDLLFENTNYSYDY